MATKKAMMSKALNQKRPGGKASAALRTGADFSSGRKEGRKAMAGDSTLAGLESRQYSAGAKKSAQKSLGLRSGSGKLHLKSAETKMRAEVGTFSKGWGGNKAKRMAAKGKK